MEQLPRGRHSLSREEVESSQRGRLVAAMCDVVAEKGYVNTSVADVLKRARVSRETFYAQFKDKQDCFMAAHEYATAVLREQTATAVVDAAELPAIERLDRVLERYFEVLKADPAVTRTILVEVYAAGEAALQRRIEVQQEIADNVALLIGATTDQERFACRMLVGAVSALATNAVSVNDFDALPKLHGPIMDVARAALATRA